MLPPDDFRAAYLDELGTLQAELVDADPKADGCYRLMIAEHAELVRRAQAIRDAATSFALLAAGNGDAQTRARAELMRRRLMRVNDYLTELEHQTVARSWRH